MTSLRTQLLAWLLPGFVLVGAVAGLGVYFSVRHAFEADLDARLGRLAGMARLALNNQLGVATSGPRGMTLRPACVFLEWPAQHGFVARKIPDSPLRVPAQAPAR